MGFNSGFKGLRNIYFHHFLKQRVFCAAFAAKHRVLHHHVHTDDATFHKYSHAFYFPFLSAVVISFYGLNRPTVPFIPTARDATNDVRATSSPA